MQQESGPAVPQRTVLRRTRVLLVLRSLAVTTGLLVAYYLLPLDRPVASNLAPLLLGLSGIVVLMIWQVRQIIGSPVPRLRAIDALTSTVPPFLLLFSTTYFELQRSIPGSFTQPLTRTDALYFTITVFTTVGFGDITAITETARVLTMVQMVGDLVLVGVAAKVVVGAVQEGLRRSDAAE